jgi:hypothetical protein
VLASDGWHSTDQLQPKWSTTIVALAVDATELLPKVHLIDQSTRRFGSRWVETPESRKLPASGDVLALCGDRIAGWRPFSMLALRLTDRRSKRGGLDLSFAVRHKGARLKRCPCIF